MMRDTGTIIKIKDRYFLYDCATGLVKIRGMELEDFATHIKEEYGVDALRQLPERLKRVESTGTSLINSNLNETIENQVGGLTADQIYDAFN